MTTQKGYIEILEFTHFVEFFSFNRIAENHKEKELVRKVTVVVDVYKRQDHKELCGI